MNKRQKKMKEKFKSFERLLMTMASQFSKEAGDKD